MFSFFKDQNRRRKASAVAFLPSLLLLFPPFKIAKHIPWRHGHIGPVLFASILMLLLLGVFAFFLLPSDPGDNPQETIRIEYRKELSGQGVARSRSSEDDDGTEGRGESRPRDFSRGILAINPNKSIYLPGDQANLQIAVLKSDGQTEWNANLKLEIKDPQNRLQIYF